MGTLQQGTAGSKVGRNRLHPKDDPTYNIPRPNVSAAHRLLLPQWSCTQKVRRADWCAFSSLQMVVPAALRMWTVPALLLLCMCAGAAATEPAGNDLDTLLTNIVDEYLETCDVGCNEFIQTCDVDCCAVAPEVGSVSRRGSTRHPRRTWGMGFVRFPPPPLPPPRGAGLRF